MAFSRLGCSTARILVEVFQPFHLSKGQFTRGWVLICYDICQITSA